MSNLFRIVITPHEPASDEECYVFEGAILSQTVQDAIGFVGANCDDTACAMSLEKLLPKLGELCHEYIEGNAESTVVHHCMSGFGFNVSLIALEPNECTSD